MTENEIPWSNCIAIGCDNAAVMTGARKGVYAFVKEKNPKIFLAGCNLHLAHLAAEKAAAVLPVSPAELLVDIFYYFSKSSLRQSNFIKFQELCSVDQKAMLKHVPTRWLSIERCLARLLENWQPLKEFFRGETTGNNKSAYATGKVKTISEALTSPSTRLYCHFLSYTTSIFQPFLVENQCDAPQVHRLHQSMARLLRDVLTKFVSPSAMSNKLAYEVDFTLKYNLKSDKELLIGDAARQFIKNKSENGLKEHRIKEFYLNVVEYYKAAASYLKNNLPFESPVLQHMKICSPSELPKDGVISTSVPTLLEHFPCLLPAGASKNALYDQLADLQCTDLSEFSSVSRQDDFWAAVLAQHKERFGLACKFLLSLLTIPHSSAHCERVFSCIRKTKTVFRPSLKENTLEALMVLKHRSGKAAYDSKTLQHLKGSTTRALAAE
ncbi:connexin 27.5 [Elysia marginata]|uniref:Connexin 27.5 n=1 Tax=Elysia marginata TaxID=1093978 RepID=A0AAV4GLX9_9GAST|nr:connexin 27.5 [Elysia marginata]